ncbi:MAG TPA: alpha/beta fold hydrolase [Oscillatoriales cyanobacterium M59_W2019_021]|nr:MAG: alpha/beta fold hydrolase [Cyanobacteria bacterium J055]HIK31812.1 alpha/beta fold hydrolase [Oscillatoriales cyanobacterium M4454_W2019_049]HIK52848.1 alpha/beta fold hydrolase [Oscillatoriales cyanobacterium M59_W2019_021]
MTNPRYGNQRDWVWRGWKVRYTYLRSPEISTVAPPILLLHGFGSSLGQWRSNLVELSRHHSVYAIDLLGFGASQKAPERYTVKLWADLVRDFWQHFIGRPAAMIGHSLGALVALTAVDRSPEIASHLALLTLPDARPSQGPAFARTLERLFASPLLLSPLFLFVRRPQFLRSVLQKIYLVAELVDDELVDLFANPPRDPGSLDVFCRLARSRSDDDYSDRRIEQMLPALSIPVLLIWGDRDRIVPLSSFYKLMRIQSATELPDRCQLVEIENAGHCAYDEYPDRVNQVLLNWLQDTIFGVYV